MFSFNDQFISILQGTPGIVGLVGEAGEKGLQVHFFFSKLRSF